MEGDLACWSWLPRGASTKSENSDPPCDAAELPAFADGTDGPRVAGAMLELIGRFPAIACRWIAIADGSG